MTRAFCVKLPILLVNYGAKKKIIELEKWFRVRLAELNRFDTFWWALMLTEEVRVKASLHSLKAL